MRRKPLAVSNEIVSKADIVLETIAENEEKQQSERSMRGSPRYVYGMIEQNMQYNDDENALEKECENGVDNENPTMADKNKAQKSGDTGVYNVSISSDNYVYKLFEEDFYDQYVSDEGTNLSDEIIHMETIDNMINDNFMRDYDLFDMQNGGLGEVGTIETLNPLGSLQLQPILHIKRTTASSSGHANPAAREISAPKPKVDTAPSPKRDSSLLNFSGNSQASFLKEIQEIHDRLSCESPKKDCIVRIRSTLREPWLLRLSQM